MKVMEYKLNLPNINSLEPIAWIIKYLTADSLSEAVFWYTNKGKNPIKFNSNPAQTPNQCTEEIENSVPNIMISTNVKVNGRDESIRKRIISIYPKQS